MTVALATVVAAVQVLALTVSGVKQAPDSLPSIISTEATILTYPESGRVISNSSGFATELHTIAMDIMVGGIDIGQIYEKGAGILGLLIRKIEENPTLGGTVETYEDITYLFEIEKLMWTIKINGVKILHTW